MCNTSRRVNVVKNTTITQGLTSEGRPKPLVSTGSQRSKCFRCVRAFRDSSRTSLRLLRRLSSANRVRPHGRLSRSASAADMQLGTEVAQQRQDAEHLLNPHACSRLDRLRDGKLRENGEAAKQRKLRAPAHCCSNLQALTA